MKNRIRLETMKDITRFVSIATSCKGEVHLTDKKGFRVNGKSLLGAMYTMEFDEVWVESDEDIYSRISEFVVEQS